MQIKCIRGDGKLAVKCTKKQWESEDFQWLLQTLSYLLADDLGKWYGARELIAKIEKHIAHSYKREYAIKLLQSME